MQLLLLLIVIQDLLGKLRNINSCITLSSYVEIIPLKTIVLSKELNQSN